MKRLNVVNYKVVDGVQVAERAAHFLDFAAKHYPGIVFSHSEVLKHCMGYQKFPSSTSQEVQMLKKSWGRVTKILLNKYTRRVITIRSSNTLEGGVRATSNEAEHVIHGPKKIAKMEVNIHKKLEKAIDLIDVSKLPKGEQGNELRGFMKEIKSFVKEVASPNADLEVLMIELERPKEDE